MRKLLDLFRRAIGVSALQDELRRMSKRLDALGEPCATRDEMARPFHRKGRRAAQGTIISPSSSRHDGGPAYLLSHRFKLLSQNEEDGVILALLKLAGAPNRSFVEIGSGASGGNSGDAGAGIRLARAHGRH